LKILVLDIETAPKIAMVWRFFKENISPKQVKDHGHIMSFAAKWLNEPEIFYYENREDDEVAILKNLLTLLDKADMVIAHNGEEFDLKQIRARAVVNGLTPPSPVKIIDTLKIARREFGFPSNSLEYLTMIFDCQHRKKDHAKFPGFLLWSECLKGNNDAWREMRDYNIQDILGLEELYLKLRPWDTKHPNVTIGEELEIPMCPKCGGTDIHWRGYAHTNVGKYKRFRCNGCGGWSRTRYSVQKKNENRLVPQVN